MEMDLLILDHLLHDIKVTSNTKNQLVTIHGTSDQLKCIGVGTDAAVFQYIYKPEYAIKLFAEDKRHKIQAEASVYQQLEGSPYFSKCYVSSDRYLVLSYEFGITLYDCLLQGKSIPFQVIQDVDDAKEYARKRKLNPRDIHLKNIFMQHGRAKVIDISEYMLEGNDYRWEHLKKAYNDFYPLIKGKMVPRWLLETIQSCYNKRRSSSIEEFMRDTLKHKWIRDFGSIEQVK